jgi:hypothetical protein
MESRYETQRRDMTPLDEIKTTTAYGTKGRDAGKAFRITEIDVLSKTSFVLRLVAALRVESYEDLLAKVQAAPAGAPQIDVIMQILQGSQPQAVHALVTDALQSVQIAPDPKHPEAFRPLTQTDIRELSTLGALLAAFAMLNIYA